MTDYVMTVLNAWPKMLACAGVDYLADYTILTALYPIFGDNARYIASGMAFEAKLNIPTDFNFGKFIFTK